MDKHTPGPWAVEDGEKLKIMATTPRGLKKSIALVGGYGGESRPANARLIAAAPDLLKACRMAIVALKGREHDGFLRDAIAKATGEAS